MNDLDKLARKIADMHKENKNPPSTAPRVAKVINTDPIEIQWGSRVILKADKLFIPKNMTIEIGDKVTIIPDEYLKMFFVINILE